MDMVLMWAPSFSLFSFSLSHNFGMKKRWSFRIQAINYFYIFLSLLLLPFLFFLFPLLCLLFRPNLFSSSLPSLYQNSALPSLFSLFSFLFLLFREPKRSFYYLFRTRCLCGLIDRIRGLIKRCEVQNASCSPQGRTFMSRDIRGELSRVVN